LATADAGAGFEVVGIGAAGFALLAVATFVTEALAGGFVAALGGFRAATAAGVLALVPLGLSAAAVFGELGAALDRDFAETKVTGASFFFAAGFGFSTTLTCFEAAVGFAAAAGFDLETGLAFTETGFAGFTAFFVAATFGATDGLPNFAKPIIGVATDISQK
jgi:hypothetical protein